MLEVPIELTSTQKGKIWESIACAGLMLESQGRLVPFVPLADDDGYDAIIYDKITGLSAPLQIKGRKGTDGGRTTTEFNVRLSTFSETRYGYLLAMVVTGANVTSAWLIPHSELRQCSALKGDKLVIAPSTSLESRDRCSPYRMKGLGDVAARLIEVFAGYPSVFVSAPH
jgi:hypothetical protein